MRKKLISLGAALLAGSALADSHHPDHGSDPVCWSGNSVECSTIAQRVRAKLALGAGVLPSCIGAGSGGDVLFANGFDSASAAQRWSDPATWNGALPTPGAQVLIPAGRTVVLDINPPALTSLTVEGTLVAAQDRDLALSTSTLMLHGGTLRFGCSNDRYLREAVITLTGAPSDANAHNMGSKVLGAMAGGALELHGRAVRSWTRLAANTAVNASVIEVLDAAGWRVGDRIVIAAGTAEPTDAEVRSIIAISGNLVTLNQPLLRARIGQTRTVDGRVLDIRTEVGLLSRNIRIEGDSSSSTSKFGGHVMVMLGSFARIDGVQFSRMGQFDRLGRYPFHWHLVGDANGQYIRNSAIDGSLQRGIVVHATQNAVVSNNVVYDTVGHNYSIEDPLAINNLIDGNLAVMNRVAQMTEPTLRTQNDNQAANFWIRAARNTFTNNTAAGAEASGFWYDGVTDAPTVFRGNTGHSAASRGINIVFNREAGLLVENDGGAALEFSNSLFHRNATEMWPAHGIQTYRNFVFADPGSVVSESVGATLALENPLFVGNSAAPASNYVTPALAYQYGASVSVNNPTFANYGNNGLISVNDIFVDWQAHFALSGARFVGTTPPTLDAVPEFSIVHAVDSSFLPSGVYVDGNIPQLAPTGATLVNRPGGGQLLRFAQPQRYAFIRLMANGNYLDNSVGFLLRSDGLRYRDPSYEGFRAIINSPLSYRLETPPALSEYGARLDRTDGQPPGAVPLSTLTMVLARAPIGVFRPLNPEPGKPDGWQPPSAANQLSAAANLAQFAQSPSTRYFWDAASFTLHVALTERWVVIRP